MQNDDLREQIVALRQEVRGLNNTILNLKQDDMRQVYGDQIRPVFMDRIERHYQQRARSRKTQETVATWKGYLVDLVEKAIELFQREGMRKAIMFLDVSEADLRKRSGKGEDEAELRYSLDVIGQIREDLMISQHIFSQTYPESYLATEDHEKMVDTLSPELTEHLLSPLANAKRVQILLLLHFESCRLAELSKRLDLKKGHIQFHLKALMQAGYIHFDRKSYLYNITPRGTVALDGLKKLVMDLDRIRFS